MIYLYSGTPGSGKSLHTAEVITNGLKRKRPIICTFDVDHNLKGYKYFTYVNDRNLTPKFLIEYSQRYFNGKRIQEDKILLVIDEAGLLFNARDWNACDRNAWLKFFSLHRHYGYCVILIAQYDRMLDRQIRSLIEYQYIHRKLTNYGMKGKFLNLIFGEHTFISVKVWYPMKEKVGQDIFHGSKKLISVYDSYQEF